MAGMWLRLSDGGVTVFVKVIRGVFFEVRWQEMQVERQQQRDTMYQGI